MEAESLEEPRWRDRRLKLLCCCPPPLLPTPPDDGLRSPAKVSVTRCICDRVWPSLVYACLRSNRSLLQGRVTVQGTAFASLPDGACQEPRSDATYAQPHQSPLLADAEPALPAR